MTNTNKDYSKTSNDKRIKQDKWDLDYPPTIKETAKQAEYYDMAAVKAAGTEYLIRNSILYDRVSKLEEETKETINKRIIQLGVDIHKMADFIATGNNILFAHYNKNEMAELEYLLKKRRLLKEAIAVIDEDNPLYTQKKEHNENKD